MSASNGSEADQAIAFAARHINASAREAISPDALLAALTGDRVPPEHIHHIQAFFDEVEVETLSDLARCGAVAYADLSRHARRFLPSSHETRTWLDDRA